MNDQQRPPYQPVYGQQQPQQVPPVPQAPYGAQQPAQQPYGPGQQHPYYSNPQAWGPQPPAPKKKRTGLKIAGGVVGGIILLSVIGGLAGGGGSNEPTSAPTTTTDSDDDGANTQPVSTDPEPETTDPETTDAPEPESEMGTYENPATTDYGADLNVTGGTASVYIVDVDWDATGWVAQQNMFNPDPDPGYKYVRVLMDVEWDGSGTYDPTNLVVTLSVDGADYTNLLFAGDVPDDMITAPDVRDGGTFTGALIVEVPNSADASSTIIGLNDRWSGGQEIWFQD